VNSSRVERFTAKSDQDLETAFFSESSTPEEKALCEKLLASRSSHKRDAREEATLSIAQSAHKLALSNRKIALFAIFFSAIATICAAIIGIMFGKS
jgi:hypothetical protein